MQIWTTRDTEYSHPPLKTLVYKKEVGVRQAKIIGLFQIVDVKRRTVYREGEAGSERVETVI
jgi:hypothetical protein